LEEDSDFFSKDLTEIERDLYDRQFRLQGWSQKIVKSSRVLIAGIGGLGCEIAKNLVMVGVGHLDLVDLDIIEHSNLNRQVLFTDAKIGEAKATAATRKLKQINPNITIRGYHSSLERLDPSLYKLADVIIGGLDSMNARLNLNAHSVRFKKPLIDGGVSGYHGHVYTIFPYENACYECNPLFFGESDEMAACTVVGIPRKRIHCVFKGNMAFQEKFERVPNPKNIKDIEFIQEIANELAKKYNFLPLFSKTDVVKIIDRHDPGIVTINAVIASFQSHETIKLLHWLRGNNALGKPLKTYTIYNGMTMKFYSIEKKKNPECIQCGDLVKHVDVKIHQESPCIQIIYALENQGYTLDRNMDPTLTILDFNNVKEIDLNLTPKQNKLRNLELITAAGFKGGEIFVNLILE